MAPVTRSTKKNALSKFNLLDLPPELLFIIIGFVNADTDENDSDTDAPFF
jgi:hypothetical protein